MPYKDVIFYSAQDGQNLKDIVSSTNTEGIFLASREALADITFSVFRNLLSKVLDVDHSRGLVMGATSDIDYFANETLVRLFDKADDKTKLEIINLVLRRLAQIKERLNESMSALEKIKHASELVDHHALYTSTDRLQLLRKTLKLLNMQLEAEKRMSDYVNDIVPKRNELAHLRVEIDGFARKFIGKKGEVTIEQMKDLRVALLEHQEVFEALHKAVYTEGKLKQ
ncbi:hypothetical protein D7S86_28320 [Pararobbsia silviterrae]|uniref:Uncharacterized protein n=2 Tax=Pararobbsia silviterrae TaxID=1792498 RepID=A0A494X700_9BURK|nr:hypothetical protein D7S86_28320 [Pararobbsia silviterrae]